MNPVHFTLLLTSSLLMGCGTTVATPQVDSFSETRAVEKTGKGFGQTPAKTAQPKTDSPRYDSPRYDSPRYTVRKAVAPSAASSIPPVLLSASHAKLCLVQVGEAFPSLSLPQLGGPTTSLATLRGKQATVVLFWHPDRWMARTALTDMQRDLASQFAAEQVAVIGVAVRQAAGAVQTALNLAQATFPQLIDTDGKAFATVGTAALPRLYVLDPTGKIVWFDIEYSEGTRRELWQTLRVLTKAE